MHVPDVDPAQLRIELRRLNQRPMANREQERSHRNRVPVEPAAKDQSGGGDPVGDRQRPFRSREKNWLGERLMNRADPPLASTISPILPRRALHRAGKASSSAVLRPRAQEPPNASDDIFRTPVPCSLTDHMIPVPMIAAVVIA